MRRPRPTVRRAIMAIPFLAAILLAMRFDRGPSRAAADAAHPGFVMRDETAASGIHFLHHRPTFDPRISNVEPHVAGLGAAVSITDFDRGGRPGIYLTHRRFGQAHPRHLQRRDRTL